MTKSNLKFALMTGIVVTSYVSFAIVSVNVGFQRQFMLLWLRSWLIAFLLVVPSLLFVAPFIRRKLNM